MTRSYRISSVCLMAGQDHLHANLNIVDPELPHDLHAQTLILLASSSKDWHEAERFPRHAHDILVVIKVRHHTLIQLLQQWSRGSRKSCDEFDAFQKEDAPWGFTNYHIIDQEEPEAVRKAARRK